MDYSSLSDEQVVARLRDGESWAMSVVYDRYARLVFSLALKILSDRVAAEEVMQEVFVKVWKRADDYSPDRGKFSSWIGGIAHNQAIDELRRRRVRPAAADDEEAVAELPDQHAAPFDAAAQTIEHQEIMNALKCIPAEQRRAIEMAYFEGMTQQEIAGALHEPLGTVKTRMRLGMQKLKSLLQEAS